LKKNQKFFADPAIDLWSVDEVRFQQYGSSCRMWIPPENKDPVILHHPTHRSVGYFGAVRLRGGKFVYSRENDKFNAEAFFVFLKYLRRISSHAKRQAVLIVDNARYHHASLHKDWRDECSKSFRLLFLPPYSPEMNPIERLWKLCPRLATHNRYFPTLESIFIAVEHVFNQWRYGDSTIRKLCAIK
jgi:transposase